MNFTYLTEEGHEMSIDDFHFFANWKVKELIYEGYEDTQIIGFIEEYPIWRTIAKNELLKSKHLKKTG